MDDGRIQTLINNVETTLSKTQFKKIEDNIDQLKDEVASTLEEARRLAAQQTPKAQTFFGAHGFKVIIACAIVGALSHLMV